MRILHIITSLRTGGAERLMTDLLPRLRGMGHTAELLLFDGEPTPLYGTLSRAHVPIHSLSRGQAAMHNPLITLRLRQFLLANHYDIIHTHNTPCQLLTALVARDTILITTEHNTTNRRRAWAWWRWIDRWMYAKYARIACVSKVVEENLSRHLASSLPASRLLTIPNGIDIAKFQGATPDTELLSRYRGKHIITMVAAFRYQKDQPTLIRAMALLPDDYALLLAGDGECRPACERLARETCVADRVAFLGFRTDVPALLASSDLLVMSSHWEGCPLSAIEGMASGIPVIASDVPGLAETVSEAGTLFPHGDHESLAKAVRRLCEDPALRAEMTERGRRYASRFSIERMAQDYCQLYTETLRQARKAPLRPQ